MLKAKTVKRRDLVLSALSAALLGAGIFALIGPIQIGSWLSGALLMIALIFGIGYLLRMAHVVSVVIAVVQVVVVCCTLTVFFAPQTAIFGVVPTINSLDVAKKLLATTAQEILIGIAPLTVSHAMTFALIGAVAVMAIVLDLLIVGLRMPIIGGVIVLVIGLIPPLIVPGRVNVTSLILTIIMMLLVTRRVSALAERAIDSRAQRAGPAFSAVMISVMALIVGVTVAPLVEGPRTQIIPGFGPALSISPSLDLGSDLRQPRETEVLTMSSDMPNPPYLRISTLTDYDGRTWFATADESTDDLSGLDSPTVTNIAPDMKVTEYTTNISVKNLSLAWLPLPYPATNITGLDGSWASEIDTRTVSATDSSTTAGSQDYSVVSREARPSAEQIRATRTGSKSYPQLTTLPADTPESVSRLAAEVTAQATNDYDRLIALQSWFRSSEFAYSLDAPVEEGFDGNSMAAIDKFLEVKAGYCAHYAAAFTLMARSLGMPSRIVIGFLPGQATSDRVDNKIVYSVTSGRLHAWPEVFFEGIGWVPFEPTQSLGTPTSFAASQPANAGGTEVGATTAPTQAPVVPDDEVVPTVAPTTGAESSATGASINWLPLLGGLIGVILLLLVPMLARVMVRQSRLSAAAAGSAPAAWREAIATASDVGIVTSQASSPRMIAESLVTAGAPHADVALLLDSIERASYSAGHTWQADNGAAMVRAVGEVRRGLLTPLAPSARVFARMVPRSLVALPLAALSSRGARE